MVADHQPPTGRAPYASAARKFTRAELDGLMQAEERAYDRLRRDAQAKDHERRMHVAAGGDPKEFEERWAGYGKELHLEQEKEKAMQRVRQSSPYA